MDDSDKLASSSAVERQAVNLDVAGSKPALPAKKPKIDRDDRQSYNAYMRVYMKDYRLRQKERQK